MNDEKINFCVVYSFNIIIFRIRKNSNSNWRFTGECRKQNPATR